MSPLPQFYCFSRKTSEFIVKDVIQATAHLSFHKSLMVPFCVLVQPCVEFPSLGSKGAAEAAADP